MTDNRMKLIALALATGLVVVTNYRHANFVGMCSKYNISDPIQRIQREDCLDKTRSRTHWFWYLLYGLHPTLGQ